MASTQLHNRVEVNARDFTFAKGNWTVGGMPGQPTYMQPSTEIEAAAAVETSRLHIKKSFLISFTLAKPGNASGWENANLSVKAKLGENGKTYYKSINSQYLAMEAGVMKDLHANFELDGEVDPSAEKLYFSLYDDTKHEKKGLLFWMATVDDRTNAE